MSRRTWQAVIGGGVALLLVAALVVLLLLPEPTTEPDNPDPSTDTVTMDISDFQKALGLSDAVSEKPYVESVLYTRGGGVESITISGSVFTGMEFRTLLNLRSTNFTITVSSDQVTITTKGFGHRVGMSQYGAEAMALEGYSYDQILLHYYAGTRLVRWDGKTQ